MSLLENKVAIITGAAQGIGKAIAEKYAYEKACVAIVDINLEKAEATAKELSEKYGVKCSAYRADVTKLEDVTAVTDAVVKEYGKLDILVNNAGIQTPKKDFWEIPPEEWDKVLAVDLKSVFLFSKAVVPVFLKQKFGNIVNTASVAGYYLWQGSAHYIAAKTAVMGLTRIMAYELAEFNIRVNCVAPGHVNTELNAPLLSDPERAAKTKKQVPLGRLAETKDLAGAYAFVASDKAEYITGTTIFVDGGLTQLK